MRFPVRIKVPLFSVVVLVAGALMASNLDTVSAKRERTLVGMALFLLAWNAPADGYARTGKELEK